MNSSKQIKYGAIISYILIVLNIVLGLVYTPWILHEIGSSHYGLYTLATTLIALFTVDFGISAAVTRFVAKYRAENDQEKLDEFLGLALKIYLLIMLVISVILIFVFFNIEVIYSNLTVDEITVFKIVYVIMSLFIVVCFPVNICNGVLNAYEQYVAVKGADIFSRLGTVIATIIVLTLHGDIYGLVLVNGIFNFITLIIKVLFVYKFTDARPRFVHTRVTEGKEFFSFSMWTSILNMSQQLIFNIIPSVLAMVANTMVITMYGFANVIEGYVYTITAAINGLFLPKVSKIIIDDNNSATAVLPLMIRVGRINHSITMLLLLGLTMVGQEFVDLWLGKEYGDLYFCILALAYPYFISSSQQIAVNSLIVVNKVKYSAIITIFIGVLNLIGAYIAAPRWGVIGVCVITGLLSLIRILIMNIVYQTILNIDIPTFFKECQLKLLPAFLISGGLSLIILEILFRTVYLHGIQGWFALIIKSIIICIIYMITMMLIGWNDFEKKMLSSILFRK